MLLALLPGCATEVVTRTDVATRADVGLAAEATIAAIRDESARIVEATQEAVVAVNAVDQSVGKGDDWDSRILAAFVGLAMLAIASYPIQRGIRRWRERRAGCREPGKAP